MIEAQARKMRAPLLVSGQHWHVGVERGRLVYQDDRGLLDLPAPNLFGRHQFDNAGTGDCGAARHQSLQSRRASDFEAGVMRAEWPARMQRLNSGALVAHAPKDAELWLDGGHNPDGGRVVAAALGDLEERVPRPLVIIAGMMATKDVTGFLSNFAGLTRHVIGVPIPGTENAHTPESLAAAARPLGMRVGDSACYRGRARRCCAG